MIRQWTGSLSLSGKLLIPGVSEILDFLIAFTLWVVLPLSLLYFVVSPESRKHFFRTMRTVIGLLALVILIRAARRQGILFGENPSAAGGPDVSSLVPPDFVLDPPRWVGLVISLVISALLVSIVGLILRRVARPPRTASRDVADTAHKALDQLSVGEELRGVIIRCYAEMGRVVSSRRKLRRRAAMTPREFESGLIRVGLPPREVQRLTRLFEEVRYGARVFGEREEAEAVACLRAIVEACEVGV